MVGSISKLRQLFVRGIVYDGDAFKNVRPWISGRLYDYLFVFCQLYSA